MGQPSRMKVALPQVLGKTIVRAVVAESDRTYGRQLFLVLSDGTHLELYGSDFDACKHVVAWLGPPKSAVFDCAQDPEWWRQHDAQMAAERSAALRQFMQPGPDGEPRSGQEFLDTVAAHEADLVRRFAGVGAAARQEGGSDVGLDSRNTNAIRPRQGLPEDASRRTGGDRGAVPWLPLIFSLSWKIALAITASFVLVGLLCFLPVPGPWPPLGDVLRWWAICFAVAWPIGIIEERRRSLLRPGESWEERWERKWREQDSGTLALFSFEQARAGYRDPPMTLGTTLFVAVCAGFLMASLSAMLIAAVAPWHPGERGYLLWWPLCSAFVWVSYIRPAQQRAKAEIARNELERRRKANAE